MKKSKSTKIEKNKLPWKSVPIDAAALPPGTLEGLVGIEELTEYQLTKSSDSGTSIVTSKKLEKREKKSRKRKVEDAVPEVLPKKKRKKKEKLATGAEQIKLTKKPDHGLPKGPKKTRKVPKGRGKTKIVNPGPIQTSVTGDPSSDKDNKEDDESKLRTVMSAWNGLFVPDPILKALNEMGFKEPTQIQMLSLPPAIKGRKDMMGAAETGSGKTLAFGIPILAGIMKAKLHYKPTTEENLELDQEKESPENLEKDENVSGTGEPMDSGDTGIESDGGSDDEAKSDNDESEEGIDLEELDSEDEIEVGGDVKEEGSEDAEDDSVEDSEGEDGVEGDSNVEELGSEDETEDSDVLIEEGDQEDMETETQLGCVKVIKNVDLPAPIKKKEIIPLENRLWALVLAPTRELAIQVYQHLLAVGKYTGIKMAVLVGGMSQQKQERMLRRCPEVVVATPGRLWELIRDGNTHLSTVDQIRFLAVDETDRMLEAGHFQELKDLLCRINEGGGKRRRQNFVFSATLSLVHDVPRRKKLKRKQTPGQKLHTLGKLIGLKDPKVVDVTPEGATASGLIETRLMTSSLLDRDVRLISVLEYLAHSPLSNTESSTKTIVFCNSVGGVRRLNGILSALKLSPVTLHSGMQQKQRLRSLEKFSKGGILLATDVAARGLDLPRVDHVIHFQVPHASETYVHRSGRTARGKREGLSVLLVEPKEVPFYNRLCKTLGKDSGLPLFPLDEHLVTRVKERVRVARDIDFLEHQTRRSGAEEGWLQKTAEEAEILLDEDYVSKKHIIDNPRLKKDLEAKKKELDTLLKRTLFPSGFSPKYPTMKGALQDSEFGATKNEPMHVVKRALQQRKAKRKQKKTKKRKIKSNVS